MEKNGLSHALSSSVSGKFVLLLISLLVVLAIGGLVFFDRQIEKLGYDKITHSNQELIYKSIYQEWENKNLALIKTLASEFTVIIEGKKLQHLSDIAKTIHDPNVRYLRIVDTNGKVLLNFYKDKLTQAKVLALQNSQKDPTSKNNLTTEALSSKIGFTMLSTPIMKGAKTLGILDVGFDTTSIESIFTYMTAQMTANFMDAVNSVQRWTILFLALIITVIISIGFYLGRDIKNSLTKLLEGTKNISRGDFSHQLQVKSNDELQILADSFNEMSSQLKEKTVSKTYLNNIIQSMGNMLIVLDENFNITSVNQAALKLLNYSESEMLGKTVEQFIKTPETISETHQRFSMYVFKNKQTLKNMEAIYVKKNGSFLPVLFTSSVMNDEQNKLQAIICIGEDITEQKKAEQKLSHLAHFDYLTNLPNRLQFEKTLNQMFAFSVRHQQKMALLYIDLDDFKKINDSMGHDAGDLLLIQIGERLLNGIREEDFLARLGGDEFALILPDIHMPETAGVIANKLLQLLSDAFYINEAQIYIGASIGIATCPDSAKNSTTLIRNADVALYRAKQAGRNNYQYFSKELYKKQQEIRKIETALYSALSNHEFSLVYQPVIDLRTTKIVGAEALLRWKNSQLGEIKPDLFIPIAEAMGLIVPIGDWILKTAISQIATWNKQHLNLINLSIAINFSPVQLKTIDVIGRISKLLDEYQIQAHQLSFELTETAVMKQVDEYEVFFKELSRLGIRIAIDDFGTGYSSLSHLKILPIHALKVDKSFIRDILIDENDSVIVRSIVTLAKNLGLEVIAEGVETRAQAEFLLKNECHLAQGFYFSKPLTVSEMEAFLTQHKKEQNEKSTSASS